VRDFGNKVAGVAAQCYVMLKDLLGPIIICPLKSSANQPSESDHPPSHLTEITYLAIDLNSGAFRNDFICSRIE
jgi:hypothetical protein